MEIYMLIHTVRASEKLSEIAKNYGVDEDILRRNNDITEGEPAVGEELLILTPTRTYTVKRGDSAERLALRFGVRRRDMAAMNPQIECEGLVPGQKLALRYDDRSYGMAAANGYYYNGCKAEQLKKRLPYLTYVTVSAAVAEGDELKLTFDGRDAVGIARSADKIPLLRVYDKEKSRKPDASGKYGIINKMISYAMGGGYKGITLGGQGASDSFLVELRKSLLGCDLILLTEVEADSPAYACEYADGSILTYGKYGTPDLSFAEGEGETYSKFASECEGSKTFIELPSLALCESGYIPVDEALARARRGGCEIGTDKATLLSSFEHKRRGGHIFPSLSNIKATLDAVHEYGYMGISFDIMRTPLPYLMMYNALFGTSTYTSVRAPEGCSRGG